MVCRPLALEGVIVITVGTATTPGESETRSHLEGSLLGTQCVGTGTSSSAGHAHCDDGDEGWWNCIHMSAASSPRG